MDQLPEHVLRNQERQKFDSVRHKIRIMQSFIDGKPIIKKCRHTEESIRDLSPYWNWEQYSYMIAHDNYSPRVTTVTDEDTSEPAEKSSLQKHLDAIDKEYEEKLKSQRLWPWLATFFR